MKVAHNIRMTKEGYMADCPSCDYSFIFSEECFGVDVYCPDCDKQCLLPNEDGSVPSAAEYGQKFFQKFGEAMLNLEDEDDG